MVPPPAESVVGLIITILLTVVWVMVPCRNRYVHRWVRILLGAVWIIFLASYFFGIDTILFTEKIWRTIFFATALLIVSRLVVGTPGEWWSFFAIAFIGTGLLQIRWVDVPLPEFIAGMAVLIFGWAIRADADLMSSLGGLLLSILFLALMKIAGCSSILFIIFYCLNMILLIAITLNGPLNV